MKFEFLKNKNKERIYPVTHSDGVFVGEDSSDMLTDVLNSKADNTSLDLKEDKSNKVTTIDSTSTDEQYPSAKAVHSTYATKEELSEIELFKFPNATIIGTPTINNGQVSNFSAQNYMKFPFIVNMQGRPFAIDIAFTTGSDVTNQQNILDGADHGLAFAIKNDKFVIVLGSKSGEWDISNGEKASSATVSPNTSYRIRISWDGSAYKFEYSTNGETYTEDTSLRITSSLSLYPTQIYIGTTASLLGHFTGIINMNYCSLTISDKVVWTGMDDVGLATRMAVDMSNIDEAGINKIKEIVAPDIPTVNNASLTIKQDNVSKGSFTANASENVEVNIDLSGKVDKTTTVNGKALNGNISLAASDVGALSSSVTHLSGDIATSEKGVANGVATLDDAGKVPSSQLPSYVDDVLEYANKTSFPTTGEAGKIYVDKATNLTWRWSGSAYVEISPSLALGETSSTAYAGDKGKTVADNLSSHTGNTTIHVTASDKTAWSQKYNKPSDGIPKTDLASDIQTSLGKADTALQSVSKADIGLGNVDNTADANKNVASAVKATHDGNGNVITNIYATKNDVVDKNTGSTITRVGGYGEYRFCKLAEITISQTFMNFPICMDVSGRNSSCNKVEIMFGSVNTTDPYLSHFRIDGVYNNSKLWIKKTAESKWEIYVDLGGVWNVFIIHRIYGSFLDVEGITLTIKPVSVSSIPEGATPAENYIADTVEKSNYVDNAIACNLVNINPVTLYSPGLVLDHYSIPILKAGTTFTFSFIFDGVPSGINVAFRNERDETTYDRTFDIVVGRNVVTVNNISMYTNVLHIYSNAVGTYSNFQLEFGDTVHDFVPYTGDKGVINQEIADLVKRVRALEAAIIK